MEAMTEAIEQQHCTMGDVHPMRACVHHHPLHVVPAESTKREKQKSKEHTSTLQHFAATEGSKIP